MTAELPPRPTRLARALGLDSNPLRRASDRAEAWIRIGLLAVFLIAGPMVASARPLDTTSPSPTPVPSPGRPSRWKGMKARFLSASGMSDDGRVGHDHAQPGRDIRQHRPRLRPEGIE